MSRAALTIDLKREAERLGFSAAGVCPAVNASGFSNLKTWLEAGYAGQMSYLANRSDAYAHPASVLSGVRSLLMLAMNYHHGAAAESAPGHGRVARYAWGELDYHDVIHARLKQLRSFLLAREPTASVRGVVDTAPLLEREFAQFAGLGWAGKNTLLLNRKLGSYFFLAALLTDLELQYDQPFKADHCGTCRACLDACPTDAFPQPYVLDATRCISYLTIELRDGVPANLREGVGDWLFGCDVCQEVCPWNRRAPVTDETTFHPLPTTNPIELTGLFGMDDEAFRNRFRKTPLWRSKRRGILRNAALVLGNQADPAAAPALLRGLRDEEPLVRGASAWALGKLGVPAAMQALRDRLVEEPDAQVSAEIEAALRP